MTETKTPKAGEYWIHKNGLDIVYFIGLAPSGQMVWQCAGDDVEIGDLDWLGWHHEPRCTGFDWVEPSPVDPGEGAEPVPPKQPSIVALEISARIWCDQEMETVMMDSEAAVDIANIIDRVRTSQGVHGFIANTTTTPEPEFCTACGVHSVVPGTKTCCGCAEYVSLEGTKVGTVKITPVDMPDAAIAMLQPMERAEFFDKYHPVESPDDWVEITDLNHMPRDGVDWFNGGTSDTWIIHEPRHCRTTLAEYKKSWSRGKFRCRRKDLPVPVPSPERIPDHRPARDVIMDIVSWLDPHPPGVPKPQEALDCAEQWLVDNPVTPAEFCTCPTVDGIQITGSSCPRHGFVTCELKPAVNRVPVRLWVHRDYRNDERYNVFVKITPPDESNLYREILCDNDGFFLEATE